MTDEEAIERIIARLRPPGPARIGPCPRCGQEAEYLDADGVLVNCPLCTEIVLDLVKRGAFDREDNPA